MRIVRVFIGIILIGICGVCNVSAAIIHVPGDQPTIQEGIDASVNGDTVLVADGTYTGSNNRDIDFERMDLDVGNIEKTILQFTWPEVDGQGDGILIYAALTTPSINQIIGEWDIVSFGWSP